MNPVDSPRRSVAGSTTKNGNFVESSVPPWTSLDSLVKPKISRRDRKPFLIEDLQYRALYFASDGCTQSEMYLDDPITLASEYCRMMMGFVVVNPRPKHVLMIGLGGGSLVKFCHCHLPTSRLTVVEIDADVIALRPKFYIPPDDGRLRVVNQDGAIYIEHMVLNDERTDVILVDAYDKNGLATAVQQRSFLDNAKRVLSPHGIFVMNLVANDTDCQRQIALIRSVFGNPTIVIEVLWGENLVVFAGSAFHAPRRRLLAGRNGARARERLGLSFPTLLQQIGDYHESARCE